MEIMELVYLWVEEYKNIHKQGFNFSPRFECKFYDEYDEDENLKDNCTLEIKENDDYIENFFGENINVTAIVGKNGSGKSTVLELLLEIIVGNSREETSQFKYVLVWNNSYLTNIDSLNIENNYSRIDNELDFFTLFIDYGLDTLKSEVYRSNKHYEFDSNRKYILEPNKFSQNKSNINLDIDNEKNIKRIISYQKKLNQFISSNQIFIPSEIIIRVDPRRVFWDDKGKKNNKKGNHFNDKTAYAKEIKELNKIFIENEKYISEEEKSKADKVEAFITKLSNIYRFEDTELEMKATANIKTQVGIKLEFNNLDENFINLLGNLPRYFLLDFISKNGTYYTDLSTGEKHLQKLIYTLIDYIDRSNENNILVMIDEIELYLHPQWQKKYMQLLLDSLTEIFKIDSNKKICFILTSHSPFIISDLPKQNILFLNGKIEMKQTFGANIHTLLSDSFFMEEGLMGEFAKGKIEEVINYLNNQKSPIKDNDEAQQLIDIIGEPIIRNQLQKMLDSKRLTKIDEIDSIKQEILNLQNRMKEIEDADDKS